MANTAFVAFFPKIVLLSSACRLITGFRNLQWKSSYRLSAHTSCLLTLTSLYSLFLCLPPLPLFLSVTVSPLHATGTGPILTSAQETIRSQKCRASFVHTDMDSVAPPYEPLEALEWGHLKMLTRDRLTERWSKPLNSVSKVAKQIQASSNYRLLNAKGQTRINQPCASPRQTLTHHVRPWPGPKKEVSTV